MKLGKGLSAMVVAASLGACATTAGESADIDLEMDSRCYALVEGTIGDLDSRQATEDKLRELVMQRSVMISIIVGMRDVIIEKNESIKADADKLRRLIERLAELDKKLNEGTNTFEDTVREIFDLKYKVKDFETKILEASDDLERHMEYTNRKFAEVRNMECAIYKLMDALEAGEFPISGSELEKSPYEVTW